MKSTKSQTKVSLSNNKTGYSIYNEDVKKRTKQNTLEDIYPKLPNKTFDIIYADPPWHYNGKLQFDKSSKSKENINFKKKYSLVPLHLNIQH